MSIPQFGNLLALVSIFNHWIYTKIFIKNVLHPFIPLNNDKILLQISSFILFIKLESIVSNGNPKKAFFQDKVKECGDTYAQNNSDKEITLQMFLYSKSVSNIF